VKLYGLVGCRAESRAIDVSTQTTGEFESGGFFLPALKLRGRSNFITLDKPGRLNDPAFPLIQNFYIKELAAGQIRFAGCLLTFAASTVISTARLNGKSVTRLFLA